MRITEEWTYKTSCRDINQNMLPTRLPPYNYHEADDGGKGARIKVSLGYLTNPASSGYLYQLPLTKTLQKLNHQEGNCSMQPTAGHPELQGLAPSSSAQEPPAALKTYWEGEGRRHKERERERESCGGRNISKKEKEQEKQRKTRK